MSIYSKRIPSISGIYESWSEVRRLGIMREIINIIGQHGYIPETRLVKALLDKRKEINKFIDAYAPDPTGHLKSEAWIRTQKGTIRNYLVICRLLNFTKKMITRWILTDYGKLIFKLPREDNPMYLTLKEKIAFLKKILENDSFYFIGLLNIIQRKKTPISYEFKNWLLKVYTELENHPEMSRFKLKLRQQKEDVKNWSSSRERHMVFMRIGWAIDLGLLKKTGEGYVLERWGSNLLRCIPKKNLDSTFLGYCNSDFLENQYYRLASRCYGIKVAEKEITDSEVELYIKHNFSEYLHPKLGMKKISDVPILERMALDFLTRKKEPIVLELGYLRDILKRVSKNRRNIYYVFNRRKHKGWIVSR